MDYAEALKRVRASGKEAKENFIGFTFGYDCKFILPYEQGIVMMKALGSAEKLENGYSETPRIRAMEKEHCETFIFSHQSYERMKMAMLLNLDFEQYKSMVHALDNPTKETS